MSRKLIYLVPIVVMLSYVGNASADPVAYWKFDDGFGSIAIDSSGNNINGTLVGGVSWGTGVDGGAAEFDGLDDFILANNVHVLLSEPFSVTAWVNGVEPGKVIFSHKGGRNWLMASSNGYLMTELIEGQPLISNKDITNSHWLQVALVWNGTNLLLYVNGMQVAEAPRRPEGISTGSFNIGCGSDGNARWNGKIDDFKIEGKIAPKASKVQPVNSISSMTNVSFMWMAGAFAQTYDVYLGTDPELTEADLVASHLSTVLYFHESSLEPGMTYYWRVDQRDRFGNVYIGSVWNFSTLFQEAHSPNPDNGADNVTLDAQLSWSGGEGVNMYDVYFGTDEAAVIASDISTFKGRLMEESFDPGLLEPFTTYYWKVDESVVNGTIPGPIWSFETVKFVPPKLGRGNILIEYWWDGGINNNLESLRGHPDFPNNSLACEWQQSFERPDLAWTNYFGARTRGYLTPPETGEYTFWIASDDKGELLLSTDEDPANAARIAFVDGWTPIKDWYKYDEQKSNQITLTAGQWYYISASFTDAIGAGHLSVAWSGPGIGDEPVIIDGSYLSAFIRDPEPLLIAQNPIPADGEILTNTWANLSWSAAETAISHDVYFGDSVDDVNEGTGDTFLGNRTSIDFIVGFSETPYPDGLTPGTTYYWRVDEVFSDVTVVKGNIWSFSVSPKKAHDPSPPNDGLISAYPDSRVLLTWTSGQGAIAHEVYFSKNLADVQASTPQAQKGRQADTIFMTDQLEPDITYFWRIDEVEADGTIQQGDIWEFVKVDPIFVIIDDFEGYINPTDRWTPAGFAQVGHPTQSPDTRTMETTIVYSGRQSMPLYYNNVNPEDYSQADYNFTTPLDLKAGGVKAYRLYVHGQPDNDPVPLYIAIEDEAGNVGVVYHPDPNVTVISSWEEWVISLSEFTSVNVTDVVKISIGAGYRHNYSQFFSGSIRILTNGTYRVGSGVVFCDDVGTGEAGVPDVYLKGFVRDMFTGDKTTDHDNKVTLEPGPHWSKTDFEGYDGFYRILLPVGTYTTGVTSPNIPQTYPTSSVTLCCDTLKDFLLGPMPGPERPVYRFFSPSDSGDSQFFCTADLVEMEELLYHTGDWEYKGIAFCVAEVNAPEAQPVYRLWSKWKETYYYTIDPNEKDKLIKESSVVWEEHDYGWESDKENTFWAYPEYPQVDFPENKEPNAVYHLFSPTLERHFYTIDPNERDEKLNDQIWENKSIAWFAFDYYDSDTANDP